MTEDAKKHSAPDCDADNTEEKGRAKEEKVEETKEVTENQETPEEADDQEESVKDDSDDTTSEENEQKGTSDGAEEEESDEEIVAAENPENEAAEKDGPTVEIEIKGHKVDHEKFQAEIREQIENCKFEIIGELQEKIHDELQHFEKQAHKMERRRRAGFILRDVIILILAALVGFFAYCLYDAEYFEFLKPKCERDNSCEVATQQKDPEVKSPEWYKQNYSFLFDSLQTKLDADKVSAYYLYTDDYKVNEIQPEYLLGMAYNRLNSSVTYDSNDGIVVPANDLRKAYIDLVGNADNFAKVSFDYHCANFQYRKDTDDFAAKSLLCADTANRQILEEIDEIYEEGSVLYFLTTATIYDKSNNSFYSFDNLFKPAVKNVTQEDFAKHKSSLNQYQYQFKKSNDKYHFSGVTKLK